MSVLHLQDDGQDLQSLVHTEVSQFRAELPEPGHYEKYAGRHFFSPIQLWPGRTLAPRTDMPRFGDKVFLAQPLERWQPDPDGRETSVELFSNEMPQAMDCLDITPWSAWRTSLRTWSYGGPSDLHGCESYTKGGLAKPAEDGNIMARPTITCLEQLATAGWQATRSQDEPHMSPTDARLYLGPEWEKATHYVCCLLVLAELLAAGLPGLMPKKTNLYYKDTSTVRFDVSYRQLQALATTGPSVYGRDCGIGRRPSASHLSRRRNGANR